MTYQSDEEFWQAMKEYVDTLDHTFTPPDPEPIIIINPTSD